MSKYHETALVNIYNHMKVQHPSAMEALDPKLYLQRSEWEPEVPIVFLLRWAVKLQVNTVKFIINQVGIGAMFLTALACVLLGKDNLLAMLKAFISIPLGKSRADRVLTVMTPSSRGRQDSPMRVRSAPHVRRELTDFLD